MHPVCSLVRVGFTSVRLERKAVLPDGFDMILHL
jgi:hypothetical protein